MPRSLPFSRKYRPLAIALVFIASLCFAGLQAADAQRKKPAPKANAGTTPPAVPQLQKKRITPISTSDTPEGSRITITSDGALSDYSAYKSGDRFYVLIPEVEATRLANGLRGRGFEDVRMQKRGNDVMVSFRLVAGAAARVNQKFNRLEIIVTVPALVAANNAANNANTNARPQPTPAANTGNTGGANTNRRGQQTGTSPVNNNAANSNLSTPPNTTGTTNPNTISANPNTTTTNPDFNTPQSTFPPASQDGTFTQPGTNGFPPLTQTSPVPLPSATPADQLAQLQPTPGLQTTTAPPLTTTNAPAPASGTSFGAALKQNWLFILLGVAALGLIAWVLMARSKAERNPVERRVETSREAKAEPVLKATPANAAVVAAAAATSKKSKDKPVKAKPAKAEPVKAEAVKSEPNVADIAPVVAAGVVAAAPVEDSPAAPVEEEVKLIEPVVSPTPVAVEQASEEVANLLAGHRYEASVIKTQDASARQMIAAELLAALTGRNTVRQERAREAFTEHGYFEDATSTLRTAESPAERASAARSLGLLRDVAATPHLIAALEDSSPEVRRASVESLAEVRDSSAVAPLEALRDRERDRRVPNALIQHAIEACVVGRAKAETTTPISSPYATTPLTEIHEPVTTPLNAEMVSPAVEEQPVAPAEADTLEMVAVETPAEIEQPALFASEASTEAVEAAEPALFEMSPPLETEAVAEEETPTLEAEPVPAIVEETPLTVEEELAAPFTASETVSEEAPPPVEFISPVPEETPAPVPTAEPLVEYNDGTASEWVDVDVNDTQTLPEAEPSVSSVIAPVAAVGTASLLASSTETAEPITEPLPDTFEPAPQVSVPEPAALQVPVMPPVAAADKSLDVAASAKEIEVVEEDFSSVPSSILRRLASEEANERATAVSELGRISSDDSFREISASFDDPSPEVRNAAARALFELNPDRAGSFTRALREASPERRRHIGAALSASGLATEAIGHLMGESREKTYDAFSLLFLMSKAGEVQPLMKAVEEHPNNEVRLAVVKLLALSGQQEILPAFRRLAVRGSLPTEVRSAVMEAIYQISSQTPDTATRS